MAFGPTVESVARRDPITQGCLVSVALFALLSGCATRVRVVPADQTQPALHAAARSASLPWWRDSLDQEIIRRHNLQALLRRNPDRALLELHSVVSRHPDVAAAAALADLNCRYAGTLQRAQPEKALGLYLNAAESAYGWIANGQVLPDRIPIIMVHGLRATPLTWQQLTNELMGNPEIRRRYQIWHYLYPTGLPFLTSAANFRDDLEEVRRLLDPDGRDFATQNMVVIGHSMGGLLTRTLVTDSGDALWNSTFAVPISEIPPDMEQLPQLRRVFYFTPKSYVKRVIFVAVPHRGTTSADGPFGRFVGHACIFLMPLTLSLLV